MRFSLTSKSLTGPLKVLIYKIKNTWYFSEHFYSSLNMVNMVEY